MNGNDGAFPLVVPDSGYQVGLTKREYLAAMAMQGLLANCSQLRAEGFRDIDFAPYARMQADWLIAELSEVKP